MNNNKWQPIETAPTNNKIIVCIGPKKIPKLFRATKGNYLAIGYTHWISLPKPPTK
jgi:hypothetical protein